jgi:glyoxylase-like metal-dependent hydrolase (beta-lactamase superfamily II)
MGRNKKCQIKMNSWKTKNGYRIFQVLSRRSNSYFITAGEKNLLIDTGKEKSYKKLRQNIESLELTDKKIHFLILTHTHFDHCQSAKKIKEESHCKIIVSERARDSVQNGYTDLPNGTMFITKMISGLGRLIGKRRFGYRSFLPDIYVGGNASLQELGIDIDLIDTGGHSSDSISVIINNEIAIVGDAMFGIFKNRVFPPYAENIEDMINSWSKLLNTDCKSFLPGHGKEVTRELLQIEYDKYTRKLKIGE